MLRVLFDPRVEPGAGSGHLRRCLRLARAHGEGAALLLEAAGPSGPGGPTEPAGADSLRDAALDLAAGVQVVAEYPAGLEWDLVVLDRRASTPAELARFLPVPVVGLDEGGAARGCASYLIDCLAACGRVPKRGQAANLNSLSLLELPPRRGELRFPFHRVLLSFGGEDPADLSGALLRALLGRGRGARALFPAGALSVVEGPLFRRRSWPPGVTVLRRPDELKSLLHEYDLVFTSWGLTTLEALAAGAAVINLNPTRRHRRLSRAGEVPEVGVGKPRLARLRRLLADRESFEALRRRYGAERFRPGEQEPEPGPQYWRSLQPAAAARCPVCGRSLNRAVARFPRRTYFRCGGCKVLYLLRFGGEAQRYQASYFFEEYRRQYGRTYLEDFQNIKQAARRRLRHIEAALRVGRAAGAAEAACGAPRLLDIGCAFGPFLQAAAEAGYRAEGLEVSAEAAAYVREELGLPCRVLDFESAPTGFVDGQTYDVISLWFVLEHFRDPAVALRRIRRLLRPGGVLAVSTPSASGISARRSLRGFLDNSPADHVTVWPPAAAAGILRRFGFRLHRRVTTGHHPERFPGGAGLRVGSAGAGLVSAFSRLGGLGDTFELYALREDGEAGR